VRLPCATHLIITGSTKELLESEVWPLVEQFLSDRGLRLSPEKTRITHISQGFDFLGQHLRKFDGKLVIQPSKKNTPAFLEKVRQLIKDNSNVDQVKLIRLLNPVITGWANYHRHISARATFGRVDHEIWHALWRWAKRRHPKKGSEWIWKRYFHPIHPHAGRFAVDTGERLDTGEIIWLRLAKATDTPIRRFVKIRAEANPFDPAWHEYFEERAFFKKFGIHRHEAGIKPS
jgi:RNA-directed DNA polymerase